MLKNGYLNRFAKLIFDFCEFVQFLTAENFQNQTSEGVKYGSFSNSEHQKHSQIATC